MITIHDFFWDDQYKPEVIKAVEILQTLTPEQVKAVELLVSSARDDARWEALPIT